VMLWVRPRSGNALISSGLAAKNRGSCHIAAKSAIFAIQIKLVQYTQLTNVFLI
jgi:hypothetical protein